MYPAQHTSYDVSHEPGVGWIVVTKAFDCDPRRGDCSEFDASEEVEPFSTWQDALDMAVGMAEREDPYSVSVVVRMQVKGRWEVYYERATPPETFPVPIKRPYRFHGVPKGQGLARTYSIDRPGLAMVDGEQVYRIRFHAHFGVPWVDIRWGHAMGDGEGHVGAQEAIDALFDGDTLRLRHGAWGWAGRGVDHQVDLHPIEQKQVREWLLELKLEGLFA